MKISFEDTRTAFANKTDRELKLANFLFSIINSPIVARISQTAVGWAIKLHLPIEWLIRRTVFSHFCGGPDISSTYQVINKLESGGVQTILDYSAESTVEEKSFNRSMAEILRTVVNAARKKHVAFAVFKVTGIGSADLLSKVQEGSTLTQDEKSAKQRLKVRIDTICRAAFEEDVRLLIDAEESWIQDAIDDIVKQMMEKYNKEKAIVFNTYQLYRTDALSNMSEALQAATKGRYFLGVKLVRGAYMEKERERARELGYDSPIYPDRESTDKAFNTALEFCVDNLEQISVMCASHNDISNKYLVDLIDTRRIKKNHPHIWFSQLYGMSDNISYSLAKAGYNVAKYLPYGPVRSVIPYLLRRATENTSVAGQSSRELLMIRQELKRRRQLKPAVTSKNRNQN